MVFRLWNYGLFGNENVGEIPKSKRRGNFINLETWDDFISLVVEYKVVGIDLRGGIEEDGLKYVGALQLPTTYSTCGDDGYPNPEETANNLGGVREMYRTIMKSENDM